MTVLEGCFLLVWGFIAGDCFTALPVLFVEAVVDLRFDFLKAGILFVNARVGF